VRAAPSSFSCQHCLVSLGDAHDARLESLYARLIEAQLEAEGALVE
jgi:hypothetical protein